MPAMHGRGRRMRMLVSVRDVREARAAAEAGADFIDLKEPARGALGGLDPARIAEIVEALRSLRGSFSVSATIGDFDVAAQRAIVDRVAAVSACGVDLVKVGIAPLDRRAGRAAVALIERLAILPAAIVPVFIVDGGLDAAALDAALDQASRGRAFPALMLDTAIKTSGSLLERLPPDALAAFVHRVHSSGRLAGLAGALRIDDVPKLRRLAPAFAGFRSAVCAGHRAGALETDRIVALAAALNAPLPRDERTAGAVSGLRPG